MACRHLPYLAILPLLIAILPVAGQAQDLTPPTVTSAAADLQLTTNGDPIVVRVDATADEPVRFEVTATYASTYRQFLPQVTPHFAYKTAAVGDHTGTTLALATSVSGLEVTVGPRCYHSDLLTVRVEAVDAAGNRSQAAVAWDGAIDMPIGPVPEGHGDAYGIAAIQLGGRMPSSAPPADWAEADVIVCGPDHLLGSTGFEEAGFHHWVQEMRDQPGAQNRAVLAFAGGTVVWHNDEVPFSQRCYFFFDRIYQDARAAASPDTNVFAHLVDGSLAIVEQPNLAGGSRLVNMMSATARDSLAWFIVNEFNHFDNRVPNVGLMFDVWEYYTDHRVIVGGQVRFSADVLDRDLDGLPLSEDYDAQVGMRDARLEFLRELRRQLHASSPDPTVGRHFLLGGNSVVARCDAEMAGLLDHIFVEDLQCPTACGTGLADMPYHNGVDQDFVRTEFPAFALLPGTVLPDPHDFSSDFLDLASAMRDSAGGPYLTLESRGSCSGDEQHPRFNEVYSLLLDDVYAIWNNPDSYWDRSWWSPRNDGLVDLHDLGRALGPLTRSTLAGGGLSLRRAYDHGEVEIVLAEADLYDCDRGDLFEYRVLLDGAVAREHPDWGAPELTSCFVAGWDTAGVDGAIRVDLTVLASEPVRLEHSVRPPGEATWTEPQTGTEIAISHGGPWDTGVEPYIGTLDVRVRARDLAGRASPWTERTVSLTRFDGDGVEITDTQVRGTTYGQPQPGGGYVPTGRGVATPDAAPPHFLEVRGTVEPGFVPVVVRWQNSLGGSGTAEGTVDWVIPSVPLQRGFNEIVVTAEDAAGANRRGIVSVVWDYPGAPGRRR
jgi:hypothetical protein